MVLDYAEVDIGVSCHREKRAGFHLAAFVVKTGCGTDPKAPVCVCVDGSTYYKTRVVSFPKIVQAEMDQMLGPRNIAFALTVCPDDAPMIGAAVAALLK